jgi:hypothetical protein
MSTVGLVNPLAGSAARNAGPTASKVSTKEVAANDPRNKLRVFIREGYGLESVEQGETAVSLREPMAML